MKIEMIADGCLFITAETELESYALKKWCIDNPGKDGGQNWIIDPNVEDKEKK